MSHGKVPNPAFQAHCAGLPEHGGAVRVVASGSSNFVPLAPGVLSQIQPILTSRERPCAIIIGVAEWSGEALSFEAKL
jgi:hypothetical protein